MKGGSTSRGDSPINETPGADRSIGPAIPDSTLLYRSSARQIVGAADFLNVELHAYCAPQR